MCSPLYTGPMVHILHAIILWILIQDPTRAWYIQLSQTQYARCAHLTNLPGNLPSSLHQCCLRTGCMLSKTITSTTLCILLQRWYNGHLTQAYLHFLTSSLLLSTQGHRRRGDVEYPQYQCTSTGYIMDEIYYVVLLHLCAYRCASEPHGYLYDFYNVSYISSLIMCIIYTIYMYPIGPHLYTLSYSVSLHIYVGHHWPLFCNCDLTVCCSNKAIGIPSVLISTLHGAVSRIIPKG